MLVVSNTSPISNLAIIGHLYLLKSRYGKIIVPTGVKLELLALSHQEGKAEITQALTDGWLIVETASNTTLIEHFERRVDRGEAEAIALFEARGADKLILDDRLGRELARERNIPTTGLLGELLHAKLKHRIASVSVLMDRLKVEARFFIREDLRKLVLIQAGE